MEERDMDRLLIASSPVEIEARSEEAGLTPQAHDVALALFHELTDRLGQAARLMHPREADFPTSRFYFAGQANAEMASLIEGLRRRPDFNEIEHGLPSSPAGAGLFASLSRDGLTGLLVKHETHEGLPPPTWQR